MGIEGAIESLGKQEWLNPVEERLQNAVRTLYRKAGPRGQAAANFLHGTWLGHPLHAALTDVPLGAWTAAVLFDALDAATGREELGKAADAAITVGIAGAVGAAITGLTDWQHTDPPARRIGLAHALLNTATLGLFATSLGVRRRSRPAGRLLGYAGIAIGTIAAAIGGNLVYRQRIGVDHSARLEGQHDWIPVLPESELPEGEPRKAEAGGVPVVLVRRGGRILALSEKCSHLGGPLAEGTVEGDSIQCPWHGSRFSLEDGRVLNGPSVHEQPCFETRVRNGQVEIAAAGQPRVMTA